jgi:hypothetical protein
LGASGRVVGDRALDLLQLRAAALEVGRLDQERLALPERVKALGGADVAFSSGSAW